MSVASRVSLLTMLSALVVAGLSSAASAQGLNTGYTGTRTPVVDWRERHQQDRIYAGVRDGSLTPREYRRLEWGESRIRGAEARYKADGVVTRGERARLDGMLDRESRAIYRNRHDEQRVGWRR
ncbi:hypothetical protein [Reyranella sp. CPCC 100927]|uniref:hypothetical protein n=1 Tax=Reyranella sp. CPCC 100927 TaxID=2599616 RepID=UPI0011B85704|nr:hypothetical protein [Reyranella sp. CPCC 100927]TWS97356.1 hypothetical protein FQU96_37815 [Reyranella sp. CPCC 100927]